MTRADREIGSDLGQYIAPALEHDVERDIAALIAEVHHLEQWRASSSIGGRTFGRGQPSSADLVGAFAAGDNSTMGMWSV